MSSYTIDIRIDWNEEDDTGLPWTFVDEARNPDRIVPGAIVLAGDRDALMVAEVVDRGDDGVVHLRPLPGKLKDNLRRLTDA
ncbi:MAG: hypothetical protein ABWZ76_08040 [Acidimicrobiales bacterium]